MLPTRKAIEITRDSVCMADDVDAPHSRLFEFDSDTNPVRIARAVVATGYLPMPSDAVGWDADVGGVEVRVRRGLLGVVIRRPDKAASRLVTAADLKTIHFTYATRR